MIASSIRMSSKNNCTICHSTGFCWRCRRQLVSHIGARLFGFQTLYWRVKLLQAHCPSWWNLFNGKYHGTLLTTISQDGTRTSFHWLLQLLKEKQRKSWY